MDPRTTAELGLIVTQSRHGAEQTISSFDAKDDRLGTSRALSRS
jgi:hypothetical protein